MPSHNKIPSKPHREPLPCIYTYPCTCKHTGASFDSGSVQRALRCPFAVRPSSFWFAFQTTHASPFEADASPSDSGVCGRRELQRSATLDGLAPSCSAVHHTPRREAIHERVRPSAAAASTTTTPRPLGFAAEQRERRGPEQPAPSSSTVWTARRACDSGPPCIDVRQRANPAGVVGSEGRRRASEEQPSAEHDVGAMV